MTKVINKPSAYGFLAGLLVFLCGLALWDAGCAHYPKPEAEEVAPTRTTTQQQDATVIVHTECGEGSGVLLDGTHVLTAFHVINCAEYPQVKPASLVVVETHDGQAYMVTAAFAEPSKDIVRLDLALEVPDIVPVKIRHARVDELVCAAVGVPDRGFKCGHVERLGMQRDLGDVKLLESNLWFGNSGGGVYVEDGSLIGLVTRLEWCTNADMFMWRMSRKKPLHTCGGYVTSIDDTSVLP